MSIQVVFYYFGFFAFPSRRFFLSKVLDLSIPLFIPYCLYPTSINLLRNLSQLSWNSLFSGQMQQRSKSRENGMLRFKDSVCSD